MSRDRGELIQELGAALRTYQRSVDAFDETVARYLGVNRTDLRALDVLLEQGQTAPGFLADALGLTTGSVTAMLDRLEKLEYILPSPRILALAGKIYGPLVEEGGPLLGRYSRAELEMLVDLLQRMQAMQETHSERVRRMGER
jgi:MarR family